MVFERNLLDFHAHILPTADHGSSSLEQSLRQLDIARKHGVSRIVATPHFYPDRHSLEQFLTRRSASWSMLSTAREVGAPLVALGAEILICDGIERLDGLEKLCIEGTNILLLELPFSLFKLGYRDSVYRLIKSGFNVVLAHIDRYDPADIELFLECGAKAQLNAFALSGLTVPSYIKDWARSGAVIALGSDIHSDDKRAYRAFKKAKSRLEKLGALDYIIDQSNNLKIPFI